MSREEEGYSLGLQSFKYGYPAVEMYRSRREWHYDESSPNWNSRINELGHTKRATHEDRFVVTPIVDAVYSRAFVDLSAEPVIVEVPAIEGRYWTVQIADFHTNSFAYIGKRQGDGEGAYALVGPHWRGVLPDGLNRAVVAPTPVIALLARVAVVDDHEAAAVALQRQFELTPLDVWTGAATEGARVAAPRPYRDFKNGDPLDFYRMLNWVLTENPLRPRMPVCSGCSNASESSPAPSSTRPGSIRRPSMACDAGSGKPSRRCWARCRSAFPTSMVG